MEPVAKIICFKWVCKGHITYSSNMISEILVSNDE